MQPVHLFSNILVSSFNISFRMFPNCTFKDKCMFIHPICKFDQRFGFILLLVHFILRKFFTISSLILFMVFLPVNSKISSSHQYLMNKVLTLSSFLFFTHLHSIMDLWALHHIDLSTDYTMLLESMITPCSLIPFTFCF